MRFGVGVGNMNGFNDESGPNACIDVAQAAEDLGFDSVWTNDHIVVPTQIESRYPYNDLGEFPAPSTIQCFDPLVVMCALAEATQSVEIGCSVLVIPYRHPAVVAKMLAAADQISGGRIVLGAGRRLDARGVRGAWTDRGSLPSPRSRDQRVPARHA